MNILTMPVGRDGCSFYRVTQPYTEVRKQGEDVIELDNKSQGEEMVELVEGSDAIIVRPGQEKVIDILKEKFNIKNKIIVLDIDDDIWDINPFAPTYRWGGTEEAKWDGKYLWKDGENNFNIERNKKNLERLIEVIKGIDLIIVTTELLKDKIIERTGNKNVEVLPNAINFDSWKKLPLRKNKTRIGWGGGSTHYVDWHTIKEALPKVIKDDVKLVLQGCMWKGTVKDLDYEFHNWVDVEAHPYKTASLNIDIAIIPLKDMPFNVCKSNIKWYEFSALEIPCVMPNLSPYKDEVEHGINGFLYDTPEEFVKYTNLLVEDKKLRKKIGKNAYKWVKENRDIKDVAKQYEKILNTYNKSVT